MQEKAPPFNPENLDSVIFLTGCCVVVQLLGNRCPLMTSEGVMLQVVVIQEGVFPVPGREAGDLSEQRTQPASQDGDSMSHNVHISMHVTQIPGLISGVLYCSMQPVWILGWRSHAPPPLL